jgi:hypothetical protein
VTVSAGTPGRAEHGLGALVLTLAEHRMRSDNVPIDAVAVEPGAA